MRFLFFTAAWSTAGRLMEPAIGSVAADYGLPIGRIDVDREPAAVRRYALPNLPVLILARGDEPVRRWVGYWPEIEIRQGTAEAMGVTPEHSITGSP